MRWKQFFTPVMSIDTDESRQIISEHSPEEITILDVRQPGEYEEGHIPGARLIPITDLNNRIEELDPDKKTIVYCAVGGRSRIAAQMLSGNNFRDVYNMSGGFKAWSGEKAYGGEEHGFGIFSGRESPEEILIIAYSLEEGLRDFYLLMLEKVKNEEAKVLFKKLSDIETNHQERIFSAYSELTGGSVDKKQFLSKISLQLMEGGMTTEEYINIFKPDLESTLEIVEIAMSIEAQALDLYQRAQTIATTEEIRKILMDIASEERTHLNSLAQMIDKLIENKKNNKVR